MRHDKGEKREIYAARGIPHLWHADVATRLLEVFELSRGRWSLFRTFHEADRVAAPPFLDLSFDLGLQWDDEASDKTEG